MRDRLSRKAAYSPGDLLGSSLASSSVRSNGEFLGDFSTEDELREEDVWGGGPDTEADRSDADDDPGGSQQKGEGSVGDSRATSDAFNIESRVFSRGRRKQSGLSGLANGISENWNRLDEDGDDVRSNGHAVIGAGGSPSKADPLRVSTPLRIIPQLTPGALSRHPMRRQSAPVNVPDWSKVSGLKSTPLFTNDDSEDEQIEKMVPPHELMAREYSQSVTFSVYEGVGRTLRGRDLTGVRTAVLRQTGFLDG